MIIHPDGRLEGTPEELAAYKKKMSGAEEAKKFLEEWKQSKEFVRYVPYQPMTIPPCTADPLPWWKHQITCSGQTIPISNKDTVVIN